ncbi:MAG: leucine-rich repeat protein [Bacteroidales bacterium]|nr:leucine-rich repeat protein [Bacteroidales bacterium]
MRRYYIIFALLFVLGSCSDNVFEAESIPLGEGTFSLSLTANLPELPVLTNAEEDVGTKASTQYTVRINWSAGDKLSVVNLTSGKLLGGWLTANSSGTSTTFSGSLQGTVNEGDQIAYFYPAQENTSEITFSGIHVDMSAQKGTTGAVPLCVYSVAKAGSGSFQNATISFSFLMSYIMMGMSDMPASAKIEHVTLTNVTNCFDLKINAGKTGFDITPTTGNIVLSPDSQSVSDAGVKTLYVAVPASASATRSIKLETTTNSFETTFTSARLQNGYAYNTNVSGFLDDDLSFEDSRVRAYCLSNFDKNGDGKLSMVEIAGVTTFPSALPAGILAFEELEFFYGLTTLPLFTNQSDLTSVVIPRQISVIPDNMFSGCSSLVEVYVNPSTPPALGANAFAGTPENMMIIVPEESVDDYQSANGWSAYADHIRSSKTVSGSGIRINTEGGAMGSENVNVNVQY